MILVTGPEPPLRAATQATSTIPIVMVALNYDPVGKGYIAGRARPGGNVTGVVLRHRDRPGQKGVVPVHPGRPIKPKVRQRILQAAELSADQLRDLL